METHISERAGTQSSAAGDSGAVFNPSASPVFGPTMPPPFPAREAPLVLLVENDTAVRNATRMLLEVEGYRVDAVDCLQAALRAADMAGRVEVLVTGCILGSGEKGTQVIDALRKAQGGRLKAVLLTGDASAACRLRRRSGVEIAITPLRAEDLFTLLRKLLSTGASVPNGPGAGIDGKSRGCRGGRASRPVGQVNVPTARPPVNAEVAALVVHDLRSSLGIISNVLKTCPAEVLSARLPHATQILQRQITKSLRMSDDLLEVFRLGGAAAMLKREPVSLTRVIVEVAQDLDLDMRRREQSLSLELPRDEVWVRGDVVRLGQVVTNILENAGKYSGRGGRIRVGVLRVGRLAEMQVRDNGIGVHPEDLPHIFEPYFRSRSSRRGAQEGSGLGLALARRIVELHGGTIEAKSDGPGSGSEFTVRLPVVASGSE